MNKLTDTFVLSNGVQVPCISYGIYFTPDGSLTVTKILIKNNVGKHSAL